MRITDRFDGGGEPFEGTLTVLWRSLPANALVSRATLTVEPVRAPGAAGFFETIAAGALGLTVTNGTDQSEVDFHARRRAVSGAGLPAGANLSADIGGGVFLAVGPDGTIPATGAKWNKVPELPGIVATRLRLDKTVDKPAEVTVRVATTPADLVLGFGNRPSFWSLPGALATPATSPDVAAEVQKAVAAATVENGYAVIPLVIRSSSLGRIAVTLDVEFLAAADLLPAGVREAALSYDFGSVPKSGGTAMQATLPAGAVAKSPQTALAVRGAFDTSRVADGPTGTTTTAAMLPCSGQDSLAQPVLPAADLVVSAVDLYLAGVGPAARLAVDLRVDDDGKPGRASVLASPVPFDVTTQQAQWTDVPLPQPVRLIAGTRYWTVEQAIDGAATVGVDATPDATRLPQHSGDAGFSWRRTEVNGPLLVRLRTVPAHYSTPVDLAVGGQRVSLSAYDPLGRVDMTMDRPEIAAGVQSYLDTALPPVPLSGELLTNPELDRWAALPGPLGAAEPIGDYRSQWTVVDTFTDQQRSVPSGDGGPVAFAADESAVYLATDAGIDRLDLASLTRTTVLKDATKSKVSLLAAPHGGPLYLLEPGGLFAVDPGTGQVEPLTDTDGATAMALSPDGKLIYLADKDIVRAVDTESASTVFTISLAATALSVTGDGSTLVALDGKGKPAAFDAPTGRPLWTIDAAMLAIAPAADGVGTYAADAGTLVVLDKRGRTVQSVNLPDHFDTPRLAVKPQGDRVYVANAPAAISPTGGILFVTGNTIDAVPVGSRTPVGWTMTVGTATPGRDDTGDVYADLTPGGLSQVVAAQSGGTVELNVTSSSLPLLEELDLEFQPPAAVAELLWADAGAQPLRTDSVDLPVTSRKVARRLRVTAPPLTAQVEVRIRVVSGEWLLYRASLLAEAGLLTDDGWHAPPIGGAVSTTEPDGTTYRNGGSADAVWSQPVAPAADTPYRLDFAGRATAGEPYFQLGTQRITLAGTAFEQRPAQLSPPVGTEARLVLPPGAALVVRRIQLTPTPTAQVPVTFIAQSPGELHVTSARIGYDLAPPTLPAPPPGGLHPPTPPEDVVPRRKQCPKKQPAQAPAPPAEPEPRSGWLSRLWRTP